MKLLQEEANGDQEEGENNNIFIKLSFVHGFKYKQAATFYFFILKTC